jgi:anaerobic sulfite reductase subunit A
MQRTFLVEQLLKWAPKLAEDIIKNANTLFYKALGKVTKGFLNMEEKVVNKLIEKAKT